MQPVQGLHHVTAISGDAQENVDFYVGVLGMRLVKKSVNQDDPSTYHLFYADAEGSPGTDLTFFPWRDSPRRRAGHGTAPEVSLAVPPNTLDLWAKRLETAGITPEPVEVRFGQRSLPFEDPHGLRIALVESESVVQRPFAAWTASTVAVDQQIRGLEGARMIVRDLGPTVELLERALGYRYESTENGWQRWVVGEGTSGRWLDLQAAPDTRRGLWGVGAIHHLAFRVVDDDEQQAVRRQVGALAAPTEVIDRFWFRSVYFKEPGGVLFELATDGPGFTADEELAHLGEQLVLPPWLEPERSAIAVGLPELRVPGQGE